MKTSVLPFILILCIFTLLSIACSNAKSPVEPSIDNVHELPKNLPENSGNESNNRSLLAVYDAVINAEAGTFEVTPSDRSAQYHYPLTQLYPNVLTVTGYGFTPNFWADIKLTHPLPGSGIDAFDPRVIAIIPANPGVSFNYPVFNCIGNNKFVLEPDGYTKLFDNLGGAIPGNTNPFKAYFKDQPYRRWSSIYATQETQRWQMNINGFGGPMHFKLVVDISTNYPNPPTPRVDNAPEPILLNTIIDRGLTSNGGSANIENTFLDWQGGNDIKCKVEAPTLFSGVIQLYYSRPGPNPNEYIFSGTITNSLLAPQGDYRLLVAAWDIPSDIHVFSEIIVTVTDETGFNPIEVTPPWLNFSAVDVKVEGNYAYVVGGMHGFHIFNISDPLNPVWVNWIDLSTSVMGLHISGGYAYALSFNRLQIIDINPPELAHIVNTVPASAMRDMAGVCVAGGYAYVTEYTIGYDGTLQIIDIDPPETAYVVNSVPMLDSPTEVSVSGGYAYVADEGAGLQIIDINPPESAYIAKTVRCSASDVCVSGGYAYVADIGAGLQIIDIDPTESAYLVKTVDTPGDAFRLDVSDGYAYVTQGDFGLQIIDIDPPESANIVRTVNTPGPAYGVDVSGGYTYVADYYYGLQIIDTTPPESAYIVKTVETLADSSGVSISNGYAYVTVDAKGLQVIDIDPLESASFVKTVYLPQDSYGVYVSEGYAYVAQDTGIQIIDIDPPESAQIVKTVDMPDFALAVYVSGSYAYVANYAAGLQIIDIDPPESAHIVKTVDTPGDTLAVHVSGGYVYVADYDVGLQIIDIEPPESAYIVKTVETMLSACDVQVSGEYAYVADYDAGLKIIDIEPPETAYIVKSVDYTQSQGVYVSGGYAYVATYGSGFKIVDISPPESAYVIKSVFAPCFAFDIQVIDNYVYLAGNGGVRIVKLW